MADARIDGTKFGEITINGKPYDSDVTVYWDGRVTFRAKEHVIELGEFLTVLRADPNVLVVGTGQTGIVKISPEVAQWAGDKNVSVYADTTPRALQMFNAFVAEGRKVVGIFHVTC
ncbi:MAG: MTH938/NDUFAF3 family protein [Candidatus Aenigmatarchaeota archaeon]